jgi:hypothetical protein
MVTHARSCCPTSALRADAPTYCPCGFACRFTHSSIATAATRTAISPHPLPHQLPPAPQLAACCLG